jgi:hypothetical protein
MKHPHSFTIYVDKTQETSIFLSSTIGTGGVVKNQTVQVTAPIYGRTIDTNNPAAKIGELTCLKNTAANDLNVIVGNWQWTFTIYSGTSIPNGSFTSEEFLINNNGTQNIQMVWDTNPITTPSPYIQSNSNPTEYINPSNGFVDVPLSVIPFMSNGTYFGANGKGVKQVISNNNIRSYTFYFNNYHNWDHNSCHNHHSECNKHNKCNNCNKYKQSDNYNKCIHK